MQDKNKGAVLVTGASSGIGKACALHLDSLGFQVFAGVRKLSDAEELKSMAPEIIPVILDVCDPVTIRNAVSQVTQKIRQGGHQGLTGLVNNAGIVVSGPLEFLPIDELRMQLEVNVVGQVAVTQAFLPLLRQAEPGTARIVNMSSYAGFMAFPFIAPYSASKFALEAISDSLRVELQPWRIFVSVIEPGNIRTPIWDKSREAAEETAQKVPPETFRLYGTALEKIKAYSIRSSESAIPAERVAEAVTHAITSRNPKTRYQVGREAKIRRLFPQLPDGLKDWLITRRVGLPQSAPPMATGFPDQDPTGA